ncbi:MAG: AAA family ATPase [Dehalobacterium sp.]|jgi:CO dehydrogenase maturation factor
MSTHIAVVGKGGTGKTTFSALAIRYLVEKNRGTVLAVDADPNANLDEALGMEVTTTISELIEQTKDPKAMPTGMTKETFIEYKLQESLIESRKVDLLAMGGPQGPGCYCYPNDLLRKYMERLEKNYDYMMTDNEAGMEHISRGILQDVDQLFLISDASVRGIRTAGRLGDLIEKLKSKVAKMHLIVTKGTPEIMEELKPAIEETGLDMIGWIPYDENVLQFDAAGKPLYDLPVDSPAVKAVYEILEKAGF